MKRLMPLSLAVAVLSVSLLAGTAYSRGMLIPQSTAGSQATVQPLAGDGQQSAGSPCDSPSLTEAEAHQAVWSLPRVREKATELRAQGVRPFTLTSSIPDPTAPPGTAEAGYVIYLEEDHGTHTTLVWAFLVDSHTGKVSDYPVADEPPAL